MTEYEKKTYLRNYINRKNVTDESRNDRQPTISNAKGKEIINEEPKIEEAYGNFADKRNNENITEIVDVRKQDLNYKNKIAKAAKLIQEGQVVIFPTETIYGLGANVFDSNAVKMIYEIKNKAQNEPLIVHINSMKMARTLVTELNEDAQKLASMFWPGPLTLILPKSISVPNIVTANLDTVAIRWPNNKVALNMISAAGVPIAASSANISGRPSITKAAHAFEELKGKVKLILDGGMCKIGIESTVVSLVHSTPMILREGKITKEQIEKLLQKKVEKCKKDCSKPSLSEMKYAHYSSNAKIYVVKRNDGRLRTIYLMLNLGKKLNKNKKSIIFVFSSEIPDSMFEEVEKIGKVVCFKTYRKMAHGIFNILRKADNKKIHAIIIEGVLEQGLGSAIMDRLMKIADEEITDAIL